MVSVIHLRLENIFTKTSKQCIDKFLKVTFFIINLFASTVVHLIASNKLYLNNDFVVILFLRTSIQNKF